MTTRRLMTAVEDAGEELPPDSESTAILRALNGLRDEYEWEELQSWIVDGEWDDDWTDDFVEKLVCMLGLPECPSAPAGMPRDHDGYVALLNHAAARGGQTERLYVVPDYFGTMLLIKLHPDEFAQLSTVGLIDAYEPLMPLNVRN